MKPEAEMKNSSIILFVLTFFSAAFLIGAVAAYDRGTMLTGFFAINSAPSQFTRDYFKLGGLSGTFFNTGLIGLSCCGLLCFTKTKCTGLTVAAYWLTVGFASFGMTFLSIWPFFLGAFVCSKIRKVPFSEMIHIAMFSTALSPFAQELIWRYPAQEAGTFSPVGLAGALLLGIVTGCVMPALCAYSPSFHKGYDLYNAGPAAGFLAFLFYCILFKSPGIQVPSNTDLGEGERLFVTAFFLLIFGLCLFYAYLLDHRCFRKYIALWKSDGYQKDFFREYGTGAALVNMGVYGLFILLYYSTVHSITAADGAVILTGAKFTGATAGAIMCMYAFCCQGAHPRNVFPIIVGYVIASLLPLLVFLAGGAQAGAAVSGSTQAGLSAPNWTLTTQAILVGLAFASGLAPVAGKFGFWAGAAAGAIHATLVMSVPLLHGGFCLYNGGFTAGIAAFLLVPVLEYYAGRKKQESKT